MFILPDLQAVIMNLCVTRAVNIENYVTGTVKSGKGENIMADKNTQATQSQEGTEGSKTYTQADFDALSAKHQQELNDLDTRLKAEYKRKADKAREDAEKAARQANMSELEKANAELEELRGKYQESQDTIALTAQKDETRKLMADLGVDVNCLDYVFVPKDMDATKARAKAFKEYIDEVKKNTFEKNVGSTPPGAGGSVNTQLAAMRSAAGLKIIK